MNVRRVPGAARGVEADLVGHLVAVLVEGLVGDSSAERHRRDAPRLRDCDLGEPGPQEELRQLCALPAAYMGRGRGAQGNP